MIRPLVIAVLLLVAGCSKPPSPQIAVPPPAPPTKASPDQPNLVFVSFDALQALHVGHLGYSRDTTPNLDRFARQATTFRNATSVASWTVPASMTWFTGVYPSEHRMVNKFAVYHPPVRKPAKLQELAPNLITLAELLKANGFSTGGFTGNAGVGGGFGYDAGFDVYYHKPNVFGGFDQSIPEALRWLREHHTERFFLFLHGYDVHGQHSPAGGLDFRFVDKDYDRRFLGSIQEQEALREEGLERGRLTLRAEDVRFWRAVYDEKIQKADARFAEFLEAFHEFGIDDRTVFVLTADHGTEQFEHDRIDHGFTLYQETLHVPLVVKRPGQTESRLVPERVSSIDVLPTVLELLQVALPQDAGNRLRGRSLVPAMNGQRLIAGDVISETDYRAFTYKRSIIAPDNWKLIYTLETRQRELFDLSTDPTERNNRAKAEPARADELQKRLFAHFERIGCDLTARSWDTGLNPVYNSQANPKK